MDNEVLVMIMCFFLFVFSILWGMSNVAKNKSIKENNEWLKRMIKENEIDENSQEIFTFAPSEFYDFMFYTNQDYIWIVNKYTKMFDKVMKKDILDVEVNVYSIEKNVKKLIALTSTYNKSTIVSDIDFKIVTKNKTYNIPCMRQGKDSFGRILNKQIALDDVNRYKLILEKDIKKINSLNN